MSKTKLNVTIEGEKALLKLLKDAPKEVMQAIDQAAFAAANKIATDAKRDVAGGPNKAFDSGYLARSIFVAQPIDSKNKSIYSIVSNAAYSAYVEFGTGNMASVPEELQSLADQYKGKGLRVRNMRARPFMWTAFKAERPRFLKDIIQILNHLEKIKK